MLQHRPRIKSAMTPFPYAIDVGATLNEARAMMDAHAIRHLPVMRGEELAGLVTRRDIDVALSAGGEEIQVSDAYETRIYVVDRDAWLDEVLSHMTASQFDVTLITRADKLVGIFTVTDSCQFLADLLRGQFSPGEPGLA